MINNHQKVQSFLLSLVIGCMVLMTGCASQKRVSEFQIAQKKAGVVYAQVNKIFPGNKLRDACDGKYEIPLEHQKLYCDRLDILNFVELGIVTDGSSFAYNELIPKSIPLEVASIVKLDFRRPIGNYFVEVVSLQETSTCQWTGRSNSGVDGALKTMTLASGAFFAGVLMPIPTYAGVAVNRNRTGGVECEGWSYKQAFHDFLFGQNESSSVPTPLKNTRELKQ